jgi:hypothetical protein
LSIGFSCAWTTENTHNANSDSTITAWQALNLRLISYPRNSWIVDTIGATTRRVNWHM